MQICLLSRHRWNEGSLHPYFSLAYSIRYLWGERENEHSSSEHNAAVRENGSARALPRASVCNAAQNSLWVALVAVVDDKLPIPLQC